MMYWGMAELAGKVLDIAHTDVLDVTQTDEVGEEKGIGRIGELPETMTWKNVAFM